MRPIDLRSDTVTQPTSAMRRAMASAEVGDDVYGEDPTVRRLEEVAAARLGKESALLVPSGTMANLAALLTHCERGQAIVCGDTSHIVRSELGGAATLGGLTYRTVPNLADGTLDERDLAAALAPGWDAAISLTTIVSPVRTPARPMPPSCAPNWCGSFGPAARWTGKMRSTRQASPPRKSARSTKCWRKTTHKPANSSVPCGGAASHRTSTCRHWASRSITK